MKRTKLQRTGSSISGLLNVWLFDGNPDESISARSYREGVILGDREWAERRRKIDKLFFWEEGHCHNSYRVDLKHAQELIRYV